MNLRRAASIDDFRTLARRRLPQALFEYIDGGSYFETTIRRNERAFGECLLRQRVMKDMSSLNLATEIAGRALSMPLVLAPVGFAGMYARRGEAQAARAAEKAGIPFTLSTVGICALEEVCAATETPPWFQLYMIRDRGYMAELLKRAGAAGAPVLVLTVDLPTPATRYRDKRAGAATDLSAWETLKRSWDGLRHWRWFHDVYLRGRPHRFGNLSGALPEAAQFGDAWTWIADNFDRSVNWRDLDFIRSNWSGPIIIKGILDPEDAKIAQAEGADGLVVSNHGGRQLDGTISSIEAIAPVRDAVGDGMELILDSGVRSGLDILKALASGADACMAGKAWAYALAAGGEAGVTRLLTNWREELETAMVLTGCNDVRDADRSLLAAE